jgi:hypothetical protein
MGFAKTLEEIWNDVIRKAYPHLDGGNPMTPQAAGVDSGWEAKKTYDFCNAHTGMQALKGSSTDIGSPYRLSTVKDGVHEGQSLMLVNTDFWETDLQARLDERIPEEPESLSLYEGAERDLEFLEQLCNATVTDKLDRRGNAKVLWVKKNENYPNDFRDVVRYGLALAHAYVHEDGAFPARSDTATRAQGVINTGMKRPDGREWNE